jgi:glycosyltransferase involved in cell wall biosynthesis
MVKLSIGIPYFNEGPLLTRCLKSFEAPPGVSFELIVFDDASRLRPEEFIPAELSVKILRSEVNVGPARGRNQILKAATGDWIHFHDADDWVLPEWNQKVAQGISQKDLDLILTEVISFKNGNILSPKVIGLRGLKSSEELLKFAIEHFLLPATGIFKRDLAYSIGGYRESLWQSEDWDFYVRLISKKPRFQIISESLSAIEVREESRSQKKIETLTSLIQAILLLQNELAPSFKKDLAEKAAWVGSQLFQLGEKALAREAFELAKTLGPAQHPHQKKSYQLLAKHGGQELAEKVASGYRKSFPRFIRKSFSQNQ